MKRVGILGYDGVTALDVTGPMEALANARIPRPGRGADAPAYELLLLGPRAGRIRCEHGLRLTVDCAMDDPPRLDTLIIPGGSGLRGTEVNRAVCAWVLRHAAATRRVVSVCTGIYGLLWDAHPRTTWRTCGSTLHASG